MEKILETFEACPFCGEDPYIEDDVVHCHSCLVEMSTPDAGDRGLSEVWNSRDGIPKTQTPAFVHQVFRYVNSRKVGDMGPSYSSTYEAFVAVYEDLDLWELQAAYPSRIIPRPAKRRITWSLLIPYTFTVGILLRLCALTALGPNELLMLIFGLLLALTLMIWQAATNNQ